MHTIDSKNNSKHLQEIMKNVMFSTNILYSMTVFNIDN